MGPLISYEGGAAGGFWEAPILQLTNSYEIMQYHWIISYSHWSF